jgi:hypothetical protein
LSTVIAHAIDSDIVDDRLVDVYVADDGIVYVADGGVVVEIIAVPVAALITMTVVAVAVVHAAIETDVRSPITRVKEVTPTAPSPISRSPEQAITWSHHPGTRYPVIVIAAPGPVSRRPDVIGSRAIRLVVNGQRWRSEVDSDSDSDTDLSK